MSGYKKMFEDVGGFDGFSFKPVFCEDDDFLIRAKIKGYKLKTCESAIVYHFVSQTIRFGDDYKNERVSIEMNSNRNFIRKWGIPISSFNETRYWEDEHFTFNTFTMGLKTRNKSRLAQIEPFFDKIDIGEIPEDYIELEQKNTNYDLRSKFTLVDNCDVFIYELNYWLEPDFKYNTFTLGLKTRNKSRLGQVEPFFDKIDIGEIPEEYINNEQPNTNYDIRSKFTFIETCDVIIYEVQPFTDEDVYTLYQLRLSLPEYEPGEYEYGNMKIVINKKF
jgi:hypothetical protein